MLALLLLAAACRPPPEPHDSDRPDDDSDVVDDTVPTALEHRLLPDARPNLLLPYDVAVDPAGGRAWVTSLVSPTVAEVDTVSGALVHVYEVEGWASSELPQVAVDGDGAAWIASGDALYRFVSGGDHVEVATTVRSIHTLVGLPGGGAVVAGRDGAGARVASIDGDGDELATRHLDVGVTSTAVAEAGENVALATRDADGETAIRVLDAATLADVRVCPAPIQAEDLVQAEDGRFLLASVKQIAMSRCDDERVRVQTTGNEIKNVLVLGDTVFALDRIGDDTARGGNWGIARRFDLELGEHGGFATGRNSGYGAVDPATERLWMNSEGTTEVWGMSPDGGPPEHRVRLGLHVEELARDPSEPTVVWWTGRLSGSVGRLDLATGEAVDVAFDGWPVAPLVHDGELYVVDLFTTSVQVRDPATLELIRTLDPGLGDNVMIQLDDLLVHPERDTLFLARGDANEVVELDRLSGDVLGRWTLAGSPTGDAVGRVEIAVSAAGLYALRSQDGSLTRVDPDEAEPVGATALADEELAVLQETLMPLALHVTEGTVYVGGFAFDPDLTRRADRDVDVTRLLGEREGALLGWRADDGEVVEIGADGEVLRSTPFESSAMGGDLLFAPDWEDRLLGAYPDDARLVAVPLAR